MQFNPLGITVHLFRLPTLRDAAVSRAEADWIIGMNGSRVAATFLRTSRNDKKSLSLGRVQTATLAMIVDHEISFSHTIPPHLGIGSRV